VQGLQQLGWTADRNVQIDTRWGAGDADRYRSYAAELVALAPESSWPPAPGRGAVTTGDPHRADRVHADS
jgi:hypothetical protein